MTQDPHQAVIHYDPERVDYSLSGVELEQLSSSSQNSWKDFCLVCLGVGVPCIVNAIAAVNKQPQFSLTLSMFLNFLIGGIGITSGIISGILWQKSRSPIKELVKDIKARPKMKIPLTPEMVDVGPMGKNDDDHVE